MIKSKILLVLQNRKNILLLKDLLADHYLVYEINNNLDVEQDVDLCIVDGASLDYFWSKIVEKKEEEKPLFLPIILVTQRNNITLATRNLWQLVEDIIFIPIRKQVLLAKIEVLLQTRRLSLQLRLQKNQLLQCKNTTEDQLSVLLELSHDLQLTINEKKLLVYYQPIINLYNLKVIGFEALARWIHPKFGFISPDQFIPLAVDINKIIDLDLLIFEQACQQMSLWQSRLFKDQNLTISVNISAQCFLKDDLDRIINNILEKTGFNPEQVKLEITERNILAETSENLLILDKLKDLGLQLWLDDFGTGYSSMNYLHFLPLDGLKIDKSFVQLLDDDQKNIKIMQSIFALAKDFGIEVVAEGIETETQLQQLKSWGCQYGQGYLFAKPLSVIQVEEYLIHH